MTILTKLVAHILSYYLENIISNLVIVYAERLQQNINLGRKSNQKFVNIPGGNIKENLECLCYISN